MTQSYETIVVGAGAAGLLAGSRAAQCGQRTLLLEKNRRAGTKILMSGGTRCNITHATDRRGIVQAFAEQGPFLHSSLAALPPDEVVRLVESRGVATKVEPGGKIFPVSDRAADVLAALLSLVDESQCETAFEEPLVGVERYDGDAKARFRLRTDKRELLAENVVLTTGGKSYPGSGTTGDGYAWLKSMGHTIVPPRPALTPITSDEGWIRELKGLTIPDVAIRLLDEGKAIGDRRGSFLFTHFGISGPVALDLSREITGHDSPAALKLTCDFLPAVSNGSLDEQFRESIVAAGKKQMLSALTPLIPRRLAESVLDRTGVDREARPAELSKKARREIVATLKGWIVSVSGTRGFKKAEVTAGGVSLDEIDSRTMASRLVPGLYVAGELLDVDGPIGGYNFQAAFSTGWLAGQSCAAE